MLFNQNEILFCKYLKLPMMPCTIQITASLILDSQK